MHMNTRIPFSVEKRITLFEYCRNLAEQIYQCVEILPERRRPLARHLISPKL